VCLSLIRPLTHPYASLGSPRQTFRKTLVSGFRGAQDLTNHLSETGIASILWLAMVAFGPVEIQGDFSIRLETAKVVKNCLKSTLVTEISRIKMSKKSDPVPLTLSSLHIAFLFGVMVLETLIHS
jgi:hypothetical protein